MADTLIDIVYRSFKLNDASITPDPADGALRSGIAGSVVDTFDLSDVDVVQFREKKALQDGMDAGTVYQGARRLRTAGTLYGKTRAELFDIWDEFMATTNAVLAQRESPADFGYLPLTFSTPTNNSADFPDLVIPKRILVMPQHRQIIAQRDQLGGKATDALAVPWQCVFVAKDPVIYAASPVDVDLSAGNVTDQTWRNRGNYIASLNMVVQVGSAAGSIAVTAGGSTVTITVPASTGNRIIRYKGRDNGGPVVTLEENTVELPRYDLFVNASSITHPVIPAGDSQYTVTFTTVTPQAGSHMWFYEAWA